VGLSQIDRQLLQRCLERESGSWEDFVDRFLGLVVHVVHHTAQSRSIRLDPSDVEDLAHEVFLAIFENDLAVLRRFRGRSSLAPYLTVVARRVVVRELLKRPSSASLREVAQQTGAANPARSAEQRISDQEEVQRLLEQLSGTTAEIVRLYHLEGLSYQEISERTGLAENSIGPTLSRAREKMRQAGSTE
jgi:RNA polymerase sigma-70 factor (ECF subfamily)